MKKEKLIDAITDIEPDVLDRYFDMKKGFSERKKPHKHAWIKWVVIAACLSLLVTTVFAAASDNNQPYKKPDGNNGTELAAEDALVIALVEYLNELEVDHDMPAITTADKMDAIRDGQQALHVAFDSSKPYFVCAYSADGQKSGEYVWIKYADASEITEQCSYLQMALAFQINPSLFVKDIMTEDATVPTMEHFQPYEPQFNEGVNTKVADTFDETFIYLNSSEENAVYYSTTAYDHEWVTFPCRYFENEYYVRIPYRIVHPDGSRVRIYEDLREHYAAVVASKRTTTEVVNGDGTITEVGLAPIEDFALAITITEENNEELNDFFDYMVSEAMESDKISFDVMNQLRHYISDQMRDELIYDYWVPSRIWIAVHIDYNLATEEEWYKACENTEFITLKTAFYDEYCSDILAERPYIGNEDREIYITYRHADENCPDRRPLSEVLIDVYHDYEIIKKLAELDYVTKIEVSYLYSWYES
ncbi:MAG: hypothetical protein IKA68_01950 [Clostridia bacterium]|nr:hypothetical protein [Clostridia bacterium]MBR2613287.1 hypothetical protein [Clostridia bacterium]